MQDPPEIQDVLIKMKTNLPLCRVCLNISMEYIEFESTLCLVNGLAITYFDGFSLITPDANNLPEKVPTAFCSSCGNDLLSAFLFLKRVENSNIILSKINDSIEEERLTNTYAVDYLEDEPENIDKKDQDSAPASQEKFLHIDMVIKTEDDLQAVRQSVKSIRKNRKPSITDEPWPSSPKNSLYTDSDADSVNEQQEEKSAKLKEPTIWMCDDCGEICMTQGTLRKHRKHHNLTNQSELKCKKCDKPFETIEALESHTSFHKYAELMSIESGKLYYRCKLCERKYRSEVYFIDHMNVHKGRKPYSCESCPITFHTSRLLQLHKLRAHISVTKRLTKKVSVEKKEKCPQCYKMVRKSFMEIHKEVHFGPKTSICTECGKQFGSRLALRTHSLIHKHSGEFPCHICSKKCQTAYALKSHIQFKHVRVKTPLGQKKLKYQCEDCGLVFQYPSKLRIHQRTHRAELPYKCPHCNRCYLRKDQFKIHMRYHNNDLPYKCDRCDKSYATRNNLSEHTKSVHDNITYTCDKCNQKFKSVTGLRKHKFIHTGYPYICPLCDLGQPFRSGLKAHLLRVHKDEFTESAFDEKFPVMVPKSGFRRPKT